MLQYGQRLFLKRKDILLRNNIGEIIRILFYFDPTFPSERIFKSSYVSRRNGIMRHKPWARIESWESKPSANPHAVSSDGVQLLSTSGRLGRERIPPQWQRYQGSNSFDRGATTGAICPRQRSPWPGSACRWHRAINHPSQAGRESIVNEHRLYFDTIPHRIKLSTSASSRDRAFLVRRSALFQSLHGGVILLHCEARRKILYLVS